MENLTRRRVLRLLAATSIGALQPSLAVASLPSLDHGSEQRVSGNPSGVLFERVAAATSGIGWRHVSGRSSEYYLPETTGAGCAFLDYDNDGWMDIYLVNSGRCDFMTLNRLFAMRFTTITVTEHLPTSPRKRGCGEVAMGWAPLLGTTTGTAFLICM